MKKYLLLFTTFFISLFSIAQDVAGANNLDTAFKNYTGWFVDLIFYEIPFSENFKIPWVLIVLIGGAIYFTFYFRFVNFRHFWTAVKVVRGDYSDVEQHDVEKLYGDD